MVNTFWQIARLGSFAMGLLLAFSVAAAAMSTDEDTSAASKSDPDYAAGLKAVQEMQWDQAVDSFTKVVAKTPENADAQNYLGYSYRKQGNLDLAVVHYKKALAVNPEHRGAHEYIGQAYLMAKDLANAEKHLAQLDSLCFFGCKEYDSLKQAVKDYQAKSS